MKKLILFTALFLFGFHAGTCNAQSPVSGFNPASLSDRSERFFPTMDGRAFLASDVLPAKAVVGGGMGGPFTPSSNNHGFYYWKTDLGMTHKQWRLAGFYRGEQFYDGNRDTIEFMRLVKRRMELPEGRVFDIDFETNGFLASGIELSRGFKLGGLMEGLSAGLTARYIYGQKIQKGTVRGTTTPTGMTTYDFDLFIDYVYDKNEIYDRRDTASGTGDGYSFDVGLKYDFTQHISLEAVARDLGGKIHWYDAAYTTAEAISQTRKLDESGFQIFLPTIRGFEGHKTFTQRIPVKYDLTLSAEKDAFLLSGTVNLINDIPLYWVDLGYRLSEKTALRAGYNTNYGALALGLAYKRFSISAYLSDYYLFKANAAGVMLSFY